MCATTGPVVGKSSRALPLRGFNGKFVVKNALKLVREWQRAKQQAANELSAKGFLPNRSVGVTTDIKYYVRLTWMRPWLDLAGIVLDGTSVKHAEETMARYLDFLFFRSGGIHHGPILGGCIGAPLAAPGRKWPQVAATHPPGLECWRKLTPGKTRLPIPWRMLAAVCALMVH